MRILITGGAGFIGSHLVKYLLNQGHEITVLDNFFTGTKENLADFLNNPNFVLIEHDIVNNTLDNKLKQPIDQIYNLACPASPPHYQKDPVETIRANVVGMDNMLKLAQKTKARIFQASTSEVYGDPEIHPQTESYRGNVNCIGRRACYDEGKRCAETLCFDYHRECGVDIRVARIFNTYGPNMALDDGRVVSNFIIQALRNDDITIYGDGSQTRSFQYVDDLIRAMVKMMSLDGFIGPVNIGNPDEFTIKELAEQVIKLINSKSKIVYKPLPEDDPTRRRPDISLAKAKLNWQSKVKLEVGLKKTIAYFRSKI